MRRHYCYSVIRATAARWFLYALGSLVGAAVFRLLAGDLDFQPGYTTRAEGQSYAYMIGAAGAFLLMAVIFLILSIYTLLRRNKHPFAQLLRKHCPDLAEAPVGVLFAQVDGDLNEYGERFGGGAAVLGQQWLFLAPPESWAVRIQDIHCAAWRGDHLLLGLTGGHYADISSHKLTRPVLTQLLTALQARRPGLELWANALELDRWRQQNR